MDGAASPGSLSEHVGKTFNRICNRVLSLPVAPEWGWSQREGRGQVYDGRTDW